MTKCRAPLGAVAVLTLLAFGSSADAPRSHAARPPRLTAASSTDYGKLPITFEQNTGRHDRRVRFVSRLGSATLFLTDTEAVMVCFGVGSRKGKVEGERWKDRWSGRPWASPREEEVVQ